MLITLNPACFISAQRKLSQGLGSGPNCLGIRAKRKGSWAHVHCFCFMLEIGFVMKGGEANSDSPRTQKESVPRLLWGRI